jgi:hypothetical protein
MQSKWSAKTRRVAKALLGLVDPYYWAESRLDKSKFARPITDEHLEAYYVGLSRHFPKKVTKTILEPHYGGKRLVHYASNRASGYALLRLDIDAHDGQYDLHRAEALVSSWFPLAYSEWSVSRKGRVFFVLVHVGLMKRMKFNSIARGFEGCVRRAFQGEGINCKFEIQGLFHRRPYLSDEGEVIGEFEGVHFGCLPLLRTEVEVERFMRLPIYTLEHLRAVTRRQQEIEAVAEEFEAEDEELLEDCVSRPNNTPQTPNLKPRFDDAFSRMNTCCFDFTLTHRRVPDLRELLDEYQSRHGGTEDSGRINRAKGVIKLRSKRFDPSMLNDGGFTSMKMELLNAVATYCRDRTTKYTSEITDTDLAVALYTYTLASFKRHDKPRRQYTVSKNAVPEMYRALKVAGVLPKVVGCNGNKASAMKTILERANLISCYDSGYIPRGGKGTSKKYVVGVNHPRYALWVQFHETVEATPREEVSPEGHVQAA